MTEQALTEPLADSRDSDQQWAIARDGSDVESDLKFLSDSQEWGPIDAAMRFSSEDEATNGAQTLCPPFTPGHAEPLPTRMAAVDTP